MAIEITSPVLVTKSGALTTVDMFSIVGEQVVENFGGEDTLSIAGGSVESAVIRGDDVVMKLSDGTYVRIKHAKGRILNVADNDGAHYKYYGGSYTYTPKDVIQTFMRSLDRTSLKGSAALDEAIANASNKKFTTIKDAIAKCVADCKSAGDANTFLRKYCGIELGDVDTGAITGWDAGNWYTKSGESIVPEEGDWKNFSGTSFTVNGLKLTVPSKLTDVQQRIINGLYTWWAQEGLDLIEESYGANFGFTSKSSATVKSMKVEFVNQKQDFLALVQYAYDPSNGKTAELTMRINMRYYSKLEADSVNGETSTAGAGYLDRTLAHEFTHAVMAANINHFGSLPNFICEGMAELTHGIDDQRYSDIFTLAGNSSKLGSNLNVKDTSSSKSTVYAAGYIFLRYLAKQSAIFKKDYVEVYDPDNPPVAEEDDDGINYSDSKHTKLIVSDFTGVVDASNFDSKLVTLDAATDDQFVVLIGNKSGNILRAGSEGSSMDGAAGNDKLYGGKGADTFSYSIGSGNDTFFGFDGSQGDVVQIFGDESITRASFKESGKNIMLTVGSGKQKSTLTFSAPNGLITLLDDEGNTLATFNEPLPSGLSYDSKKTKLTIAKGAAITSGETIDLADYASTVKEIDASKFDRKINLIGNKNADVLRAGTEGAMLDGGLGADKLYGGSGADTFSYSIGGGNDTFFNFDGYQSDVVQIFGDESITRASFKESGKNIMLTVGSGKQKSTLTFSNPNGLITLLDDEGNTLATFNEPLPSGVSYDSKKTKLTVAKGASITADATIDARTLAPTLKEIDAAKFDRKINLIGNKNADVLRAGTEGAMMDGGLGADKLYGGSGADTFSYSIGGGNDTFFSFDGYQSDVVQIFGDESITRASFKESGKNIMLTVGSGKQKSTLTFSNPNGLITLLDDEGNTLSTFNEPLPSGVTYNSGKTSLTIAKGASIAAGETIVAESLAASLKDIDASKFDKRIGLVGNKNGNVLKAGTGGSTMDGGLGADKLYGGSGADTFSYSIGGGKDTIDGYDYAQGDVVKIDGTVKSASISGKNVALNVGAGSITILNAVDKTIELDINGASGTYRFNKTNNTLAKARVETSAELPTSIEDYWFERIDRNDQTLDQTVENDPLEEIMSIENMSVGFELEPLDRFKASVEICQPNGVGSKNNFKADH